MNIWVFPSFYPSEAKGEQWKGIFVHRQLKGLQKCGANVQVIIPVNWAPLKPFSNLHAQWKAIADKNIPEVRQYDGITVHHPRVANLKPSRLFNKPYADRYRDCVVKFFSEQKLVLDPANDIFYSQWLPESGMVINAAELLGVKTAIMAIGDDVLIWPNENAQNKAKLVTTLQRASLRMGVAGFLGVEANKFLDKPVEFKVVHRGVDHWYFKPSSVDEKSNYRSQFGLPTDRLVILTVGTAIARKGWLDLMDALARIKNVFQGFVLAGVHAGPPDFDLDVEAEKRGLKDFFINLHEVKPSEASKVYNAADIFCLPSHWEGIANAVVEAMSSGLPVLTTDVCGHPELVESGFNGLLVPPKRPDLIEKELLELLTNASLRATLGNNAREFIVTKWGDFQSNSRVLFNLLQDACDKKG